MDFSGKVVIITGASSGIGASCALHFAKLSACLALVGRNVKNLENVSEQCEEASGNKPLIVIADISVESDVKRIVPETINKYGRLDVLVNNAGIILLVTVMDDINNFDWIMATNVRGPYLLTQQAIPYLIKTKGNVINISSVASTMPTPKMTPYCMTKAAIDMFTKCVALQLAPEGVRVNSVNPGPVVTEIFRQAGLTEDENRNHFANLAATMPLRKVAVGSDVAKVVVFLASDSASCITGSMHEVDCGLHLGDPVIKSNIGKLENPLSVSI